MLPKLLCFDTSSVVSDLADRQSTSSQIRCPDGLTMARLSIYLTAAALAFMLIATQARAELEQ